MLSPTERAFVWVGGRAVAYLGAGRHFVWMIDKSTRVERVATDAPLTEPLDKLRRAIVSSSDYVEATVSDSGIGLHFVDGKIVAELGPGRYAAWKTQKDVAYVVLDKRAQVQSIAAQEILTHDRVTLRLNLSLVFAVQDARRVTEAAVDVKDALYLAAQLAAREAVAGRTLDELLDQRDSLSKDLFDKVRPRAEALGLRLDELGVKDVILPGDMRELLNKVIEAKKRAEANVILRREEAAATRSLAQTASTFITWQSPNRSRPGSTQRSSSTTWRFRSSARCLPASTPTKRRRASCCSTTAASSFARCTRSFRGTRTCVSRSNRPIAGSSTSRR